MYPQTMSGMTLLRTQSDLVKVPLLLCRKSEWHGLSDGFQGTRGNSSINYCGWDWKIDVYHHSIDMEICFFFTL
jgi:hypothetical protein